MNNLLKTGLVTVAMSCILVGAMPASLAGNTDPPQSGSITGRSVAAGVLSFLVWPGIGQAVNNNKGPKVATHAVAGLFPPFRFWSGWDGLVNRKGGYWDGKF